VRRGILHFCLIGFIGLIITFIPFFSPVIHGLDQNIIGTGGDAYQFIWLIWHFRLILEGKDSFLFTTYQFFPSGRSLHFFTTTPSMSILGAFISFVVEEYILIYNLLVLLTFFLSFLFMYILSFRITKRKWFAVLISIFFSYLPCHFARASGHLNLASIHVLPLIFYFIHKFFFKNKVRISDIGILFLVLNFFWYTSYQLYIWFTLAMFLFSIFYIILEKMRTQKMLIIRTFLSFLAS
jgi:hypothetical protein